MVVARTRTEPSVSGYHELPSRQEHREEKRCNMTRVLLLILGYTVANTAHRTPPGVRFYRTRCLRLSYKESTALKLFFIYYHTAPCTSTVCRPGGARARTPPEPSLQALPQRTASFEALRCNNVAPLLVPALQC
jgi:hypothetical protein